ncbi:hypothetical protein [Micromonospora musae]|uniref:hypothetical protein n=1 Tax=Micromonospora musae TaxID=1894970 RepID=UPI0033FEE055
MAVITRGPQVSDQTRDPGDIMAGNAEDMITLTSTEQDLGGSNLSGATAPGVEDLVIADSSELGIYDAAIRGRTAAGLVYSKVGAASY